MTLDEARNRFDVARSAHATCLSEVDVARRALAEATTSLEPLDQTAREAKADVSEAKRKLKAAGQTAQKALMEKDPAGTTEELEVFYAALTHLRERNAFATKAVANADHAHASVKPRRDAVETATQRLHTSETALREAADKLRSVIGGTIAGACG